MTAATSRTGRAAVVPCCGRRRRRCGMPCSGCR
jgi:hypothetical protein